MMLTVKPSEDLNKWREEMEEIAFNNLNNIKFNTALWKLLMSAYVADYRVRVMNHNSLQINNFEKILTGIMGVNNARRVSETTDRGDTEVSGGLPILLREASINIEQEGGDSSVNSERTPVDSSRNVRKAKKRDG